MIIIMMLAFRYVCGLCVFGLYVMHVYLKNTHLLFVIVMEAISGEFRVALPWELLYTDDLAVIAETEEELIKRLNEWKDNKVTRHESQYE